MTDLTRPLFITGLWRSGTTLLSRIIDSFENYSVTYDTLHFMRFIYYELDKISNNSEFNSLIYKNQNRINSRYNLNISFDSVIHKYKFNSNKAKIYDALMRCIYKNTVNWGEKSNLESSSIDNFLKLFPKGKVIFLIRDPRAVLYSWKKYTNSPTPSYLNSVINSYINLERAKKYMNNENILILKYENLILKPTKEVQNICNFLNVEFSKKYLNLDQLKDINNKKWKINSVHPSSKNNFDKSKLFNWKNNLKSWEVIVTEIINKDLMNFFDYELSKNDYRKNLDKNLNLLIKNLSKDNKNIFLKSIFLKFFLKHDIDEFYPNDPKKSKYWSK